MNNGFVVFVEKNVSPTPLTTAGRSDTDAAGCQISCLGMSEITADSRTNRRQDRAEADSGQFWWTETGEHGNARAGWVKGSG